MPSSPSVDALEQLERRRRRARSRRAPRAATPRAVRRAPRRGRRAARRARRRRPIVVVLVALVGHGVSSSLCAHRGLAVLVHRLGLRSPDDADHGIDGLFEVERRSSRRSVTPGAAVMKSTTLESGSSRRWSCSPDGLRRSPTSSAERRAMRTSSAAVSRIRTGASGATTVVMSRPSTTTPGPTDRRDDRPEQLDQVCAHCGDARDAADDRRDPRLADRVGHVDVARRAPQ